METTNTLQNKPSKDYKLTDFFRHLVKLSILMALLYAIYSLCLVNIFDKVGAITLFVLASILPVTLFGIPIIKFIIRAIKKTDVS